MTPYDKKLVRLTADIPNGDNVMLQLPVAAVKKLAQKAGRLPLPEELLRSVDMDEILKEIDTNFKKRVTGEIFRYDSPDGTKIRITITDR